MPDILHLARIPVFPPTNGRERRIWEMTGKLAEFGDVLLASPGSQRVPGENQVTALELSNPLLNTKIGYIHLWNAAFVLGQDNIYDRLQAWLTQRHLYNHRKFDLVVCESPQMLRAGLQISRRDDASLLVNKHNASHEILQQYLDETPIPKSLAQRAIQNCVAYEQWGIDNADAVVFQSDADRGKFNCPADTFVRTIPNGTSVSDNPSQAAVTHLRQKLDTDLETFTCVFVGSYDYGPNRSAARIIDQEIAPELPDINFLLIGRNPPSASTDNVTPVGFVDDLDAMLSLADVALCPLWEGSGTKLKMMDYLAAGLPIVTTSVGASGIDLTDGETALIRESPEEIISAIREIANSPELAVRLAQNAAELGNNYSWDTLLDSYDELLTNLLNRNNL